MNDFQADGINSQATLEPIRSEMADDPTFAPLVDMFIDELQTRFGAIQDAWRQRQFDELATLTHQLKGAGGGYGFPQVTDVSRDLETEVNDSQDDVRIEQLLNELQAVCDAVLRGRG